MAKPSPGKSAVRIRCARPSHIHIKNEVKDKTTRNIELDTTLLISDSEIKEKFSIAVQNRFSALVMGDSRCGRPMGTNEGVSCTGCGGNHSRHCKLNG